MPSMCVSPFCSPISAATRCRKRFPATWSAAGQSRESPCIWPPRSVSSSGATTALREVEYIIEAHFNITDKAAPGDNPGKFQEMFTRRLKKGQCYRQPVLGCREFTAFFSPCEEIPSCPQELKGTRDLGYMLYDLDYSDPANIRPLYFRAVLVDGKLDLREVEMKS